MSYREDLIERVTEAIQCTEDVPYSIRLTRLVQGEHTFELRYNGREPEEFSSHEDAMDEVQRRKARHRAESILNELGL